MSISNPTTGRQLQDLFGSKCKVILYSDIGDYDSLGSLMKGKQFLFILVEQEPLSGHWVVFIKRGPKSYEYFDSYGLFVDEALKFASKDFRNKHGMSKLITQLMINSPKSIRLEYNQYPFQKESNSIATCGKWCAVRCAYSELNIDEFHDMFGGIKDKDKLVADLF